MLPSAGAKRTAQRVMPRRAISASTTLGSRFYTWPSLPIAAALAQAGIAVAAEPPLLRSGAYEVEVRLELPHVEGAGAAKRVAVCLTEEEIAPGRGLKVRSDNNPLSRCPVSNVRRDGSALVFDILCPGANQARATAVFDLAPEGFRGRIEMRMGGKNMTMAETQHGRRTGDCTATGRP